MSYCEWFSVFAESVRPEDKEDCVYQECVGCPFLRVISKEDLDDKERI